MNWLKTLAGWASSAWSGISGAVTDPVKVITSLWHYITSLHDVLAWLTANPIVQFYNTALDVFRAIQGLVDLVHDVLERLASWIWRHQVLPVRTQLRQAIARLDAWARMMFVRQQAEIVRLYRSALAYTRKLVGIERAQRIKGDRLEHAAMLKAVAACLATVQQQAASAYNAALHDRIGLAGQILDDMAGHTPVIKEGVDLVLKYLIDLENIDDPVLRWALNKALAEVINNAEVDKVAGGLAQQLLAPIIGQPKARGLHDVVADIAARLAVMEGQWAAFMRAGGSEVEQAGNEWKDVTGVLVNLGFLGFTGLAVADPAAWATGVADTVGVAGNAALGGIVDLIHAV